MSKAETFFSSLHLKFYCTKYFHRISNLFVILYIVLLDAKTKVRFSLQTIHNRNSSDQLTVYLISGLLVIFMSGYEHTVRWVDY